jgi:aspartate/methionine/tyrosine aminotransferase
LFKIENIAFAFANEGDGILTTRPVYGRYELDFGLRAGVKMVYAGTETHNCFQPDITGALEIAFVNAARKGVKVKALLIINPHNPLGT